MIFLSVYPAVKGTRRAIMACRGQGFMGDMDSSFFRDREPQEEDLSQILRNLMKAGGGSTRSRKARMRLANDELTRAYLEAGMLLIAEQMKIEQVQVDTEQVDEESLPFFNWLARQSVLKKTEQIARTLIPTEGTFRHRWEFQSGYIADLLAYALSAGRWFRHVSFDGEAIDVLVSSDDFAQSINEVAYRDICALLENPAHKISILASVAAARDPRSRKIIGETYQFVNDGWEQLYRATLEGRGLRLRRGISLQDFGDILSALADGISMRQLGDPNATFIDHDRRETLLGKAVLAVAAACIDIGDGLTLEEVVNLMVRQDPSNEDG